MKNMLKFEYNIDIDEIKLIDGIYTFDIDYRKYNIYELKRPTIDIDEINNMLKEIINNYNKIILNTNGKPYTKYNDKYFSLVRMTTYLNDEIILSDIINNQIFLSEYKKNSLYRTNWASLWENKVDYLEYQINELALNYKLIRDYFNYYIGLAENSIQYFNLIDKQNLPVCISHRKIGSPNYSKEFYNPINIIIDYRVRDIAEYIKSIFFAGQDWEMEFNYLLSRNILNNNEYNLLFARLLYPSYAFNCIQNIIELHENEDTLLKYIERIDDYEDFLNKIYIMISKRCPLIKIDWLIT